MILLRSREGYDTSSLPCRYTAWLSDRSDPRCLVEDWERVLGAKLDVIDIPGHHFGPFEADNVRDDVQSLYTHLTLEEPDRLLTLCADTD